MLDLIIRGGDVVTPQGVARCDVAIKGETIAAVAAPGTLADSDAPARHRRGGQDRHARRHRSARAHAASLHDPGRHDPLHARPRSGRHGRALRRHHHADRFRLRDARDKSVQAAIEARDADFAPKSCCDWAYHLMLSSEPPHTQFAELGRGDPGRLSDHQDLHHQHLAAPHRAHDRLRRHLGDLQGAGQGGRARRHPRRGQRHRHAHVRQADPRGPASASRTWRRCTTRCRRT